MNICQKIKGFLEVLCFASNIAIIKPKKPPAIEKKYKFISGTLFRSFIA
jgi:hypothetical protein